MDRGMFVYRLARVAADRAVQSDGAGLVLQTAGLAYRGNEKRVVRRGRDAEMEVVVATLALSNLFRRLRIRWEIHDDIHEAFP
jgi:hypothetical protein